MLTQSRAATGIGLVLLVLGMLGLVPNPVAGGPGGAPGSQDAAASTEAGLFTGSLLLDATHIVTGFVGIWAGLWSATPVADSRTYNVGIGAVYVLGALLGVLASDLMGGLLAANGALDALHLLVGSMLLSVALLVDEEASDIPP